MRRLRIAFSSVQFLIDTGSSVTFVSKMDSERINIPQSAFNQIEIFLMAGSKYKLMNNSNTAIFYLKDAENKSVSINKTPFTIALPTRTDEIDFALPSIIGRDFLKENKLSFHFLAHKNEAFLETERS